MKVRKSHEVIYGKIKGKKLAKCGEVVEGSKGKACGLK